MATKKLLIGLAIGLAFGLIANVIVIYLIGGTLTESLHEVTTALNMLTTRINCFCG